MFSTICFANFSSQFEQLKKKKKSLVLNRLLASWKRNHTKINIRKKIIIDSEFEIGETQNLIKRYLRSVEFVITVHCSMIRNRQAVAPVGLQPVLFNVQQQKRPAACAPPPAGTGNNQTSGSTVAILACLIIIIITIVICAIVFIFFVNFEDDDVSCSPRCFHEFFN